MVGDDVSISGSAQRIGSRSLRRTIDPSHTSDRLASSDPARAVFAAGTAQIGIPLSQFEHRFVNGFDYVSPRIVGARRA
jgi:hypothetical protein